jgi:hypothetical protein
MFGVALLIVVSFNVARIAGADSSPRTFSITTHSGCRTSIAAAM